MLEAHQFLCWSGTQQARSEYQRVSRPRRRFVAALFPKFPKFLSQVSDKPGHCSTCSSLADLPCVQTMARNSQGLFRALAETSSGCQVQADVLQVKDEMVKLRIRPTIQPEACRECRHQLGFNLEHSQTSKRVAQSLSVQVGPKNCEKVTRERCVASIASLCGVGGTVWEVQEESRALCKCVWDSLHSSQELTCQLRRGNRTRKGDKRCPGKNRKCQNTGDV